ncbi:hypothetical protein ILUMI_19967 [Ignelater luminosus]|uniref:RRM domain-containing protein n=1 Tax=Ignelater luminosus TaxID=2038154 RepID=A0A8K0CF60_IGNLU|nr:hypothetical protein ILUMI_19967 [Ignelater luminosus]
MKSKTIKGFKVIPIQFSATSSSQHDLFIKQHTAHNQAADKPVDRTLFILNVPPYATENSFKAVFSCAGPVKNVIFQNKPQSSETTDKTSQVTGFKVAYVVFEKPASVQKALSLTSLEPLSTEDHPVETGLKKWIKEYNSSISNQEELQKSIDIFMAKYDKEQKKLKQQEKQTDDGGWTVVTKKGRNPGVSRKKSVEDKITEKNEKAEKRKYLDDFYVFQKREAKMKRVAEMRKEFEQAKKKVEAMKQARKFKPY